MWKDYDVEPISFYKDNINADTNVTNINQSKNVIKVNAFTNTQKSTKNAETQLNYKDLIVPKEHKKYNKKELEHFLNKSYDLINDVLISRKDEKMDIYDDEEQNMDNISYNTIFKFSSLDDIPKSDNNKNIYKISDMTWSCKGNILAVSYYIDEHIGPCSHIGYILFYFINSFNPDFKSSAVNTKTYSNSTKIELNSCIKCIEKHPTINNIFIAGSYKGEIYYINIGNEKDLIEYTSKLDSCFYRECVVSVRFVKMEENIYYIASISSDGRLLLWNPSDKLQYPIMGYNLRYPVRPPNNLINPSYFTNNPYEPFDFIIGTYEGNLFKCCFNKPNEDITAGHDLVFMEKKGVVWRNAVRILISEPTDFISSNNSTFTE